MAFIGFTYFKYVLPLREINIEIISKTGQRDVACYNWDNLYHIPRSFIWLLQSLSIIPNTPLVKMDLQHKTEFVYHTVPEIKCLCQGGIFTPVWNAVEVRYLPKIIFHRKIIISIGEILSDYYFLYEKKYFL